MRILFSFFTLLFLISPSFAKIITVAVAANVNNAFEQLEKAFSKEHPNIKLEASFGASGTFTAQIKQGAQYDVFLSADTRFPQELYEAGLTVSAPVVYARGEVAIFSVKPRDFTKGLSILKDKDIATISIANPKTAPYGKASGEALKNYGIYDEIEGKLIFAKSIAEVLTQTLTAADIGFLAKSTFYNPKMAEYKKEVHWITLDPKLYKPIDQGIVILKNNNADSKVFYNFILSDTAKKIFIDFGYSTP